MPKHTCQTCEGAEWVTGSTPCPTCNLDRSDYVTLTVLLGAAVVAFYAWAEAVAWIGGVP